MSVHKPPVPPCRLASIALWQYILLLILAAMFIASLDGAGLSGLSKNDVLRLPTQALYIIQQMFPPSLDRIAVVGQAILQTLEMALIGNLIGVPISLAMAIPCTRTLSPHPLIYLAARALVTLLRTTPSLIWAILMIAAVGLGPRAGTMTLVLVTIGFCSRFYAEAMEETDPGPSEALTAIGAGKLSTIVCTVIPAAMPALINTTLFNLEYSTRSSAVLGIVGAGGIGIELLVSLRTFRYDEASAILILVFLLVMGVEQGCAWIRRSILESNYKTAA